MYICLRLMEGADIYQIAENCHTRVKMIEIVSTRRSDMRFRFSCPLLIVAVRLVSLFARRCGGYFVSDLQFFVRL